jgi:hypothetical protein
MSKRAGLATRKATQRVREMATFSRWPLYRNSGPRGASSGVDVYLSEGSLVRFYKASKKGLRLDWVANFTRTIPPEVATKKVRADEVGAFDNYVVLHYDPAEKAFSETEWEQLARTSKDPILFGLMKGRRILYFVGDWIDEVCDLTLDQLADVIGKDAVKTIA